MKACRVAPRFKESELSGTKLGTKVLESILAALIGKEAHRDFVGEEEAEEVVYHLRSSHCHTHFNLLASKEKFTLFSDGERLCFRLEDQRRVDLQVRRVPQGVFGAVLLSSIAWSLRSSPKGFKSARHRQQTNVNKVDDPPLCNKKCSNKGDMESRSKCAQEESYLNDLKCLKCA